MQQFVLLALLCFSIIIQAQNADHFFKVPNPIDTDMPAWAAEMYSQNPCVFEVDDLYNAYFKTHPFVKTLHTQNYKFWRRSVVDFLNDEGYIVIPTREEENLVFKNIKKKHAQLPQKQNGWTSIGPFECYIAGTLTPYSNHANIYSLAQSVSNPDILYAGTESSGVFKTTDKALTWTLVSKNEVFVGGLTAIQIHPTDPNNVIVGNNNRLYQSTDGGLTWNEILYIGDNAFEIKFHPTIPTIIFCAADNGLYKSTDGGATWTTLFSETCWDVDFHPSNPDSLYLLKKNSALIRQEFFVSGDVGATWTLKDMGWYSPSDPANASLNGGKIAVSPADPNRVYAALIGASKADDNGWIGVYRSDNQGATWTNPVGQDGGPYNSPNTTPWNLAAYTSGYHQGFYNFDCEASPNNADLIWIGTVRLSESSDGGQTFIGIGGSNNIRLDHVHADIQDIEVQGNDVWVASDGGLNYSNDDLMSHASTKYGIIGSNYWGFGSGWNEDVLVGGRYHNGNSGYYQTYGLGHSHKIGGVEESTGYVHPIESRKSYFNQWWSNVTVVKSVPDVLGGNITNHPSLSLIPNESYGESNSSGIYFDSRYADHLFLGVESVLWKSTDAGATFFSLNDFGTDSRVLEIALGRSNPDYIYVVVKPNGSNARNIHKSTDGGNTWTQLPNVPTNNRNKLEISINPQNENELWVCANDGNNSNKVFKTIDGGNTWVNMTTAALNGEHGVDILYQGGTADIVYLATNNTVFYWDSGAMDWIDYGANLPLIINTLQMRPFYRDSKLRIATGGRGMWESALATPSLPVAQPITYADVVSCSRDTVQFDCYSILDHAGANWQWTFSPTPAYVSSTTVRNPKVLLEDGNAYDVTLTITDGLGNSDTKTILNMVEVLSECEADTIPGQAMQVAGSPDYAQTPAFDLTTNIMTFSAWVKLDGIQPNYAGVIMNDGNDAAGLNFRESNNTLGYHWPGGSWSWDSNLEVPDGEWAHVAMVTTPSSVTLYLNGVGATHNTNLTATELTTFKIGSYRGWGSRNMSGEIDEVCIWNRALSQAEIRELMHLTKEDVLTDQNLLAYYQFNEAGSNVLDRKGLQHASVNGNATKVISTAPVGGGVSERMTVNSSGTYNFAQAGASLTFPSGGTTPNGELVVSHIHLAPTGQASSVLPGLNEYWIINNYGSNQSITALENIALNPTYTEPDLGQVAFPNTVEVYERNFNDYEVSDWTAPCLANAVTAGDNGVYEFDNSCNTSDFGQFYVAFNAIPPRQLSVRVLLQGAYVGGGEMHTILQTNNQLPLNQPFATAPWNYMGTESVASFPADVTDWVLVELRNVNDSYQVVSSRAAFLRKDGTVMELDGSAGVIFPMNEVNVGDYYVIVRHRNHLSVLSAVPVTVPNVSPYDFTTAQSQAYGEWQLIDLTDGNWGLYSGDINGDGILSVADYNAYVSQAATVNAYISGDTNLDQNVTTADFNLYLPNSSVIGVEQVRY